MRHSDRSFDGLRPAHKRCGIKRLPVPARKDSRNWLRGRRESATHKLDICQRSSAVRNYCFHFRLQYQAQYLSIIFTLLLIEIRLSFKPSKGAPFNADRWLVYHIGHE